MVDVKKDFCCLDSSCDGSLKESAEFLKIIAEENRLKILCILLHGERCVCEIWQYLKLPQNLTSHHLKILKNFGLITSRKDGLNVFYAINKERLASAKNGVDQFLSGK